MWHESVKRERGGAERHRAEPRLTETAQAGRKPTHSLPSQRTTGRQRRAPGAACPAALVPRLRWPSRAAMEVTVGKGLASRSCGRIRSERQNPLRITQLPKRTEKHGVHGVFVDCSTAANTYTRCWGPYGGILLRYKSILPEPRLFQAPSSLICAPLHLCVRPLLLSSAAGLQLNASPWSPHPWPRRPHTLSTPRGCCGLQPRLHPPHNTHRHRVRRSATPQE